MRLARVTVDAGPVLPTIVNSGAVMRPSSTVSPPVTPMRHAFSAARMSSVSVAADDAGVAAGSTLGAAATAAESARAESVRAASSRPEEQPASDSSHAAPGQRDGESTVHGTPRGESRDGSRPAASAGERTRVHDRGHRRDRRRVYIPAQSGW